MNKPRIFVAAIILLATMYIHSPMYALLAVCAAVIMLIDASNAVLKERW